MTRERLLTANPWTRLRSTVVYKNPWIQVREDIVIQPDGKQGIYGVVEPKIAVGIVALSGANEVYLVGQYRYPVEQYSWEIVEGGVEDNEQPIDTARREMREEIGIEAADIILLGPEVHLSNCHSSECAYFFLARGLTGTHSSPEGTEVLQVKRVPIATCLSMVEDGEITDAMSIIAIYRTHKLLKL